MTGHTETPRVIDNEHVGAALLDELGTDAGTGTGHDNRFATVQRGVQAAQDFRTRVRVTYAGP